MTLKNVLEDICMEEYALPANAPAHRFTRRHRRAVNAVLYPDGLPKTKRRLPLKRRVIAVVAIVALALLTGAAAAAVIYHYNGFDFIKENDKYFGEYYIMLVKNMENAPKTIEKIIYEDNVPEDFTLVKTSTLPSESVDEIKCVENIYASQERTSIHGGKDAFFMIKQYTKSFFLGPITDDCTVTPVEVKGCKGFTVTSEIVNAVVWDSGDYIHIVNGLLSVEELLEIAENMIEK